MPLANELQWDSSAWQHQTLTRVWSILSSTLPPPQIHGKHTGTHALDGTFVLRSPHRGAPRFRLQIASVSLQTCALRISIRSLHAGSRVQDQEGSS
jgi:hypothetical protein